MGFFTQLLLLLWKNFTLRKRQRLRLVAEIIFPLALFLILVVVRTTKPDLKVKHPECHYDAKAMPSAGTLPFLQSFVCTFNNPCHQTVTDSERSDLSAPFNQSALTQVVSEVEEILTNRIDRQLITDVLDDVNLLLDLLPALIGGTTQGNLTLGNLVIDPTMLTNLTRLQGLNISSDVIDFLLNTPINTQLIQPGNDELSIITLIGDFLPQAYETRNQTAEHVRQRFCDERLIEQLLKFPDNATSDRVHNEICSLTLAQFTEFYYDFISEFNATTSYDKLVEFIRTNSVRNLNFNTIAELFKLYGSFQQIRTDLQNATGIQTLLRTLEGFRTNVVQQQQQQQQQAAGISQNPQDGLGMLSTLMCGRSSAFTVDNTGIPIQTRTPVDPSQPSQMDEDDMEMEAAAARNMTDDGSKMGGANASIKHCNDIRSLFGNSDAGKVLWRQVKPLIEGQILYYPQNNITERIIRETGIFFEDLESIVLLADDWLQYYPTVYNTLNNSRTVNALRSILDTNICSFLESYTRSAAPGNMTQRFEGNACEYLSMFLSNGPNTTGYDWRDALTNINELFAPIAKYGQCFNYNKFKGYTNLTTMLNDGLAMIEEGMFWAAIQFDGLEDATEMPTKVQYRIRMDVDRVDSTNKIQDKYHRPGTRSNPLWDLKYFTFGFAYIQDMLEHAVIKIHTGVGDVKSGVGVLAQQFPYPCYIQDKFIYAISRMLPLFMILAWLLTTAMLCKSIVYEKEARLKEVMKIMGLGNLVHWVAWFINAFIMMLATVILLVILLKVGGVLEHSDPSVVLFFMVIFAIVTVMKCFLISTFFARPNLAACCAGFIYFMLYLPYMLMVQWDDVLSLRVKLAACLSANVAFGYGCNFIALYEEQSIGIQWSNIGVSPLLDDEHNMLHSIFMMLLDAFLYGLLTWYIEAVFPGQYGIPKKWYFPIQKSYWCGKSVSGADRSDRDLGSFELHGQSKENMEEEPKGKKVGVAIRNLRKVYSTGKKLAVDGLTLNFYEDQITSFLGHNGAGKTTTMSILTGLFPPTEGTAYIQGENILTKMDHIRHSLGVCPQHNVLFDLLTVEEHMWFYARLKGSSSKEVKAELEQMLKDVGLPSKRKELSQNLSGGMKRKLSVAIAFVGGSKTVILDEPTAGVDPYARRAIWQLLLKFKKGHTIILSTHHMDEADILGDRIAIISQGRLCCVGSSLFLKNKYGNGYYLTLVRDDVEEDEDEELKKVFNTPENSRPTSAASVRTLVDVKPAINDGDDEGYVDSKSDGSDSRPPTPPSEGATPGFSIKKITAFISKFVRDARLVEDNTTELCYQLPDEAAKHGDFEKLFLELERSHKELGISSFGISDTSLEEVFLKVAEQSGVDDEPTDEVKRNKLEEEYDGGRVARPVTRLSFRRKKKLSLLGNRYSRVESSTTDLMAEDDAESLASVPASEYGDAGGFSHSVSGRVTGWKLVLRQFIAVIIKRFHHVRRSKKGFLCEVVLPAAFILLAMIFSQVTPPFSEQPPLELHPWLYVPKKGDNHLSMFYSNDGNDPDGYAHGFEKYIQRPSTVGNRCNNKHSISGYPCQPVGAQTWSNSDPLTNTTIDCDCSSGWPKCPAGAGGPTPPEILLDTTDYLYNASGRDISDWLVKTMKQFQRRRFGGLSFGEIDSVSINQNVSQLQDSFNRILTAANNGTPINTGNMTFWNDLAIVLPTLATKDVSKVWFNNKAWAASVAYINTMNNLILRSNLPSGTDPADYAIVAINHPMEMTKKQLNEKALYSSFVDVVISICVIFALSFIPASFTMYLIEERASNSKHLQFVSGINPTMYWFSNFVWDLMNYIVPAVLCFFIFLAFNKEAYVSPTNAPCLVALLFLYGWSMIPLMYPFSRLFSVPSTALVVLKSVNIFLGTTATLATFILEFLQDDEPDLKEINDILKKVFLVLPQYCLGRGLLDMAINQVYANVYARFGFNRLPNPFDWDQVGKNLFSMFMLGIFFFILNLLMEYNFFIRSRQLKPKGSSLDDEDEDVAKERKRVMSGGAKNDILRLEELTKVYPSRGKGKALTAVDRLCVGVPKGQCFGLLGVNGAGKTTTFKMLTGDVKLSKGNAYVCNNSILNHMVKVRQDMGYCPQFDALDSLLTGEEHLMFYARLRGIPESEVKQVAHWAVRKLGLLRYVDKISSSYSGGNKRKLSTAISLIGNPLIIFLDEPTTGMDPGARRFLWNCINNIVKDGRSVILTSHSMEECEALCGRLAIMVNGQFQCIGSTQHLKNKFGDGYTIIIRVSGEFPDIEPVEQFINQTFPSSVLKEKHHNMLQYQLGSQVKLSKLFGQIEAVRDKFNIEDYSVSQTTLDQVFINFAKQQTDLTDDESLEELPADLAAYGRGSSTRIEIEAQSLAGSMVGLIGRDHLRQSGQSFTLTQLDQQQTQGAEAGAGADNLPVFSEKGDKSAPIISMPASTTSDPTPAGTPASIFGTEDEVEYPIRKRPRPVAKFDLDPPAFGIPDADC